MSNAIEIEAKAIVKEEDYRKLATKFEGHPRYIQINYYVDSDDRILSKEGLGLRVRLKDGKYNMTLKTPLSQGLLEKNADMDKESFLSFRDHGRFPNNDIKRFLTMLDIDVSTLKIVTSLTTDRTDVEYEGGLLSIDKNNYSGITDYEIEFEYNNLKGSERILKELFEKEGIECDNFVASAKHQRAMVAASKK